MIFIYHLTEKTIYHVTGITACHFHHLTVKNNYNIWDYHPSFTMLFVIEIVKKENVSMYIMSFVEKRAIEIDGITE